MSNLANLYRSIYFCTVNTYNVNVLENNVNIRESSEAIKGIFYFSPFGRQIKSTRHGHRMMIFIFWTNKHKKINLTTKFSFSSQVFVKVILNKLILKQEQKSVT